MAVIGVDGVKGGWFAVSYGSGTIDGSFVEHLADLPVTEAVDGIAVDVPIGLPTSGRRKADAAARQHVGARHSSVFSVPVRPALDLPDREAASQLSKSREGVGITPYLWGIRDKILEAEAWVRTISGRVGVWEVHPEVSFGELLEQQPIPPKWSWAGTHQRIEALRSAGFELGGMLPDGGRVRADDVLDAAVAAWSADRLVRGAGRSFPEPPERDEGTGRDVAIWA